jgi:hypothetical protein
MQISGSPVVVYPEELRALESVLEEACVALSITPGSAEAAAMALKIMLLYEGGIDDSRKLLEAAIRLPDPAIRLPEADADRAY